MQSVLPEEAGGHMPPAASVLLVLQHECLAARALDKARFVCSLVGRCLGGSWHSPLRGLACHQVQLRRVLPPVGRTFQIEENRQIVPPIFDRDATDNRIVVDVVKAKGEARRVVRAPPL